MNKFIQYSTTLYSQSLYHKDGVDVAADQNIAEFSPRAAMLLCQSEAQWQHGGGERVPVQLGRVHERDTEDLVVFGPKSAREEKSSHLNSPATNRPVLLHDVQDQSWQSCVQRLRQPKSRGHCRAEL